MGWYGKSAWCVLLLFGLFSDTILLASFKSQSASYIPNMVELLRDSEKLVDGGLFVVIEGIHGCGKSTQVELLKKRLQLKGYSVCSTREVSDTPLADQVYKIAFQENGEGFQNPIIMTLLIAASRASRVSKIIRPSLQAGSIVISDRYEASMFVYQHFCDGVEEGFIRLINRHVTGGLKSDTTFLLDVPAAEGLRRRIGRLKDQCLPTGWDARPEDFHKRSREGYLQYAKLEPNWIVLDGMKPVDKLNNEIYSKVKELLTAKGG